MGFMGSIYGKHSMVTQFPNEWREVPGYSAYAVNRCGDLVDFNGRVEASVLHGRRSYTLEGKFTPRLICAPSDLIVRAFGGSEEEARRHDFIEEFLPSMEAEMKQQKMQIIVFTQGENGRGRIFRGHTRRRASEILMDVEIGRGFILEDDPTQTTVSYGPGMVARVETKVDDPNE